jgi:hypothetical protein
MHILAKTERAFVDMFLSSSLTGSLTAPEFTIYCGQDSEEKTAPCIVIACNQATEDFQNSGVWHVKTELKVKEIAADSNVTSSFASEVFEAFLGDTVGAKAALNRYPGYVCHALLVEDSANNQDGDTWVQSILVDIVSTLV